jgi:hypothetical protein
MSGIYSFDAIVFTISAKRKNNQSLFLCFLYRAYSAHKKMIRLTVYPGHRREILALTLLYQQMEKMNADYRTQGGRRNSFRIYDK